MLHSHVEARNSAILLWTGTHLQRPRTVRAVYKLSAAALSPCSSCSFLRGEAMLTSAEEEQLWDDDTSAMSRGKMS